MVSNGTLMNPPTNGHGPLTRPPAPAEALDRAPTGDHHQMAANGDGRDKRGRFAKGWKGGPGNPFGKQVAMLRCELVNAVTRDGLEDSESLPGESIGMPSGSLSELLDKIETQFCPDLERERQQAARYKLLMPQLADVLERAERHRQEAIAAQAKGQRK